MDLGDADEQLNSECCISESDLSPFVGGYVAAYKELNLVRGFGGFTKVFALAWTLRMFRLF